MSATKTALRTKPLRVAVDGTTIGINGSNQLSYIGGGGGGSSQPTLINKGTDYAIVSPGDAGVQFTGNVVFTLPAAVAIPGSNIPFRVGFLVPPSGELSVICVGSDLIQNGVYSISSTGNIFSSDFGTTFWLVNTGLNQWVVERQSGSPIEMNI